MIFMPCGRGGDVGGDVETAQIKILPPDAAGSQTIIPLRNVVAPAAS